MADSSADSGALDPRSILRDFTSTFRGYDQQEVKAWQNQLKRDVEALQAREAELARRVEDAERRAGEAESPDESRLTALLGEETARILDAAREAANEIRAKAEAKTAQLVRDAQDESTRMTTEAGEVLRLRTTEAEEAAASIRSTAEAERDRLLNDATTEADRLVSEATAEAERLTAEATAEAERMTEEARAEAERVTAEAQAEAERVTAEARAEADQVTADARAEAELLTTEATSARDQALTDAAAAVESGRQQGRDMVAEAQVVRERILTDLARRRKAARAQLEQLRAARERLLEAYAVVRRTLEEATTELTVAVPEARLAAEAAGRRIDDEDDLSVEEIEAELDAGRFAGLPLLDQPTDAEGVETDDDETAEIDTADGASDDEAADDGAVVDETDDVVVEDGPSPDPNDVAAPVDEATPDVEAGGGVSNIFARLRAEVPADVDADAAEVVDGPEPATTQDDDTDDDVVAAAAADDDEAEVEDEEEREETILERRDRHTVPLERDLARVLKRRLADDENDKLDLIRRRTKKDPVDAVLGADAEHREAFAEAIRDVVAAAAEAGSTFAADLLDESGTAPLDGMAEVDDLVDELVAALIGPIRDKLADLLDGSDGDDALDGVRACYRQWKGRAGDLGGHAVHAAFNRGVYAVVPDGTPVSWVLDDSVGPCPDGADDALGGAVDKGEEFPTGHLHPPAHPECRCLLVPGVL